MDIEMINYLVYLDSDTKELRTQKNIYEKLPIDLDSEKIFGEYLSPLWDRAKYDIKTFREGLRLKNWSVNEPTFRYKNTPLHIAAINQNLGELIHL